MSDVAPGGGDPREPDRATAPTVRCALCGAVGEGPLLGWMLEMDSPRGAMHYCPDCARQNLRGIEGRLQQEWW